MEPRIAELLIRGGIVSREQLTEAHKQEKENNSSISKEIVRLGFTTEEILAEFLAKQFGIEFVELVSADIDDAVFSVVPPQILQKHQLIPINLIGSSFTNAIASCEACRCG